METWTEALQPCPLAADVCRKHVASRPCKWPGGGGVCTGLAAKGRRGRLAAACKLSGHQVCSLNGNNAEPLTQVASYKPALP